MGSDLVRNVTALGGGPPCRQQDRARRASRWLPDPAESAGRRRNGVSTGGMQGLVSGEGQRTSGYSQWIQHRRMLSPSVIDKEVLSQMLSTPPR